MPKQRNPFIVALVVIAVVAGLLAFVFAGVSSNSSSDPLFAPTASAWAGALLQVAIFAVFSALIAAAITWRPTPRAEEPVAVSSPRDVDTTGMTPAEQRFFSES